MPLPAGLAGRTVRLYHRAWDRSGLGNLGGVCRDLPVDSHDSLIHVGESRLEGFPFRCRRRQLFQLTGDTLTGALETLELVSQLAALGLEAFINSRRAWSRSRSRCEYGRVFLRRRALRCLLDQVALGK